MTEKQAEAEIRYRLAKFLLFRLQEENLLTPEESEKVRQVLCKKYKPLPYLGGFSATWRFRISTYSFIPDTAPHHFQHHSAAQAGAVLE